MCMIYILGALNINEYLQSAYGTGAADVALALSQHTAAFREHADVIPYSGSYFLSILR